MNIFILFLVVLFMAGYYFIDSPSMRVTRHDTEYAVTRADLRTIAECTAAAHTAAIKDMAFDDICVSQNEIHSEYVCLNDRLAVTKCEIVRNKKPAYSFLITITRALPENEYNSMMEILESDYSNAGTFGIFQSGVILSGGTTGKRTVPAAVIRETELTDGQLVYLTQYEIPDAETEFTAPTTADIDCPVGTVKTYRFSRWQCIGANTKTNCAGDMIWDSDLLKCVPDESRKPLCGNKQTAVMVDSVWECIDPFPDKACPAGMVARLNYSTLEWECVTDPTTPPDTKKCDGGSLGAIYGQLGATLRVPTTSCTDCEQMITNTDTCISYCVPDPTKINDPKCYPAARTCDGASRAFYFGFPSPAYTTRVEAVAKYRVPFDKAHSQNRRFNCMDCGERGINTEKSFPPYIAICNE